MSEVEVDLMKVPVQLDAQASLLSLESLEAEVELEKMPVSLEMEASLMVPACLGTEVESQETGLGHSRAE